LVAAIGATAGVALRQNQNDMRGGTDQITTIKNGLRLTECRSE